jgi:Rnl2 family RNA ligase
VSTCDSSFFISVDESGEFFEKGGFLYAKTLFRGNFDECLRYPNEFPSQISGWLGLPPIEGNVCEGVVIRPVEPIYLRNGSRILLKNKNARFAEKKSLKKREPKLFTEPAYSEALNALLPVAETYVTENRLTNVESHIGQISIPRDAGKLIGLFNKDILEDFLKEHSGGYAALEKSEQKILNRYINAKAAELIKQVHFQM